MLKMIRGTVLTSVALGCLLSATTHAAEGDTTSDHLKFGGEFTEEKGNFTLTGSFGGGDGNEQAAIYSSRIIAEGFARSDSYTQSIDLEVNLVHGKMKEVILRMGGAGEITKVTGEPIIDWSVRRDTSAQRYLVIRIDPEQNNLKQLKANIETSYEIKDLPDVLDPMLLVPADPKLHEGLLRIRFSKELAFDVKTMTDITRIDPRDFAVFGRSSFDTNGPEPLAFRSFATIPSLSLSMSWAQPDAYRVVFNQFSLEGQVSEDKAHFILKGIARVRHPNGGEIHVLGGSAALTKLPASTEFRIVHRPPYYVRSGDTLSAIARRAGTTVDTLTAINQLRESNVIQPGQRLMLPGPPATGYNLVFDKPGEFPVTLEFDAGVEDVNGWRQLRFTVAPSSLRPVRLNGLEADTEFRHLGSAQPERTGETFLTHLGATDGLNIQWKSGRPEGTGRLFYSAESLAQISVRPGLMRQVHSVRLNVMQGEMNNTQLAVSGTGEVVRVLGKDILEWDLTGEGDERQLLVQFNQSIKSAVNLEIHTQTPLGVFPLSVDPMGFQPEGAIRTGGYLRVINDGSVRLEVTQASGLSQISPNQFPRWQPVSNDAQQFAYRFSDANYGLTVQADDIVPEVSVSQVIVQHVGENETTIEATLELEIREAPIREFSLSIPEDYVVTSVQNQNLSDYFITPNTNATATADLRIVFTQPLTGQEAIYLKLERNRPLEPGEWTLPHVQPIEAKTVRGYIGVSADPGLRLTVSAADEALSEVGTSFFPKRVEGLQLAWRWREPNWEASINVERLAMFVQADAVHLFSIGEGIANGSSIFNYLITGSPVSTLTFSAPTNYSNLEFTGRDVRSWKLADGIYEVYLQSPVAGAYTLLATYDRQFEQQGATLNLEGIQPTGIQAEQGYIVVVSDFQFQVEPATVSNDLIKLESGEIPAEHLLLFEAAILDAYQYLNRPYQLALELSPFAQGETQDQVIDRAEIGTEVSGEGQVLTTVQFLLKSKGRAHLRMAIPSGVELWTSLVNGAKVVPVSDGGDILIPLPQGGDPNAIITMNLNLASKSKTATDVTVALPIVAAPILQTTWTLNAETNHRLVFLGGAMTPSSPMSFQTGYDWLTSRQSFALPTLGTMFVALIFGGLCFRWATREGRRRFDLQNTLGGILTLCVIFYVLGNGWILFESATRTTPPPQSLDFSTPFLEANSDVSVQLMNIDAGISGFSIGSLWPAVLGVFAWGLQFRFKASWQRRLLVLLGWGLIVSATLQAVHGAPAFLLVLFAFFTIYFLWPALLSIVRMSSNDDSPTGPASATGAATLLALGLFLQPSVTDAASIRHDKAIPAVVTSVTQDVRAQDDSVLSTGTMNWTAAEGQSVDFLRFPAVLTSVEYDKSRLTLLEHNAPGGSTYRLTARATGAFEIRFAYQLKGQTLGTGDRFNLPTAGGLVNRVNLLVVDADVEVTSRNLVSQERELTRYQDKESTRAALVLGPQDYTSIEWKPRSRDTSSEEAVYYGEITHLFIPNAGIIEGVHDVLVRPARGQLDEIELLVPAPFTITDVEAAFASAWRFDPDTRILRVPFNSPIASTFVVRVSSQIATQPLPYRQSLSILTLGGATDQIGTVGVATSSEVQLQQVLVQGMTPINLEDFTSSILGREQKTVPSLRLRRSFRYEKPDGSIELEAVQVEPDVRIATRETLSLGDDRTVLATQITANITRAGIFKLSFLLPAPLEVESLTGAALSHWTELESDDGRIVTLHLRGKTEGQHEFSLTLTGRGQISGAQFTAPRFIIREAAKQQGQLIVVPELGVRLNISSRESATQLDPSTLGIKQRGVQAFRLLQNDWSLVFDLEQIDPWIQVNSLQDFNVKEGQVQVNTILDYEIQNAGVNTLSVRLPVNAESVTFAGQHITDFIETGDADGRLSTWEVKLSRRLVGNYSLQVSYKRVGVSQTNELGFVGVMADTVNLQRGFVTIRANGRLEVRIPKVPATLTFTDWQTIPSALRRNESTEANQSFRVIDPDFDLNVQVVRHGVAQLLAAQVDRVDLNSTMSSNGELLTEVKMWIHPGDKRLLNLKLPAASEFWFAFINGESAFPWKDGDKILIPLDENSDPAQAATVEFFYTSKTTAGGRKFDYQLMGPEFDLPLQNITWTMSISPEWKITRWDDRWQFQALQQETPSSSGGLTQYFSRAQEARSARTQQAESLIQKGNEFLAKGDQQLARKAYRGAMELSQHDAALNEDARVQWQNLKQQQALVGLNVRMDNAFAEPGTQAGAAALQLGRKANYTQQQAQQLIEQNSKEENEAMMRLAGKLVQQQEAAQGQREAIRATLPQQEQKLIFTRSLHIDKWDGLELGLKLERETSGVPSTSKTGLLLGIMFAFIILMWFGRASGKRSQPTG